MSKELNLEDNENYEKILENVPQTLDADAEKEMQFLNSPNGINIISDAALLSEEKTSCKKEQPSLENTLENEIGHGPIFSLENTGEILKEEDKAGTFGAPQNISVSTKNDLEKLGRSKVETLISETPKENDILSINDDNMNIMDNFENSTDRKSPNQIKPQKTEPKNMDQPLKRAPSDQMSRPVSKKPEIEINVLTPKIQERILLLGNINELPIIWTTIGSMKAISVSELKNLFTQLELLKTEKSVMESMLKKTEDQLNFKMQKSTENFQDLETKCELIKNELQKEKDKRIKCENELEEAKMRLSMNLKTSDNNQKSSDSSEPICNALREALNKGRMSGRQKIPDFAAQETERLKNQICELEKMLSEQKINYEKKLAIAETRITASKTIDKNPSEMPCTINSTSRVIQKLSKIIENPQGFVLFRLLSEIKILQNAAQNKDNVLINKTFENIAQIFENSKNNCEIANILKNFIDPVMNLSNIILSKSPIKLENFVKILDNLTSQIYEEISKIKETPKSFGTAKFAENENQSENSQIFETANNEETEEIEEEVYWSDFSDENYEEDENQDQIAIKIVSDLQKWISSSKFTEEFIRKNYDTKNTQKIKVAKLLDGLIQAQCSIDQIGLMTLLKKLEIDKQGKINYVDFIRNLREQSISWWTEYINNNTFDQRNRISRKGNMTTLTWPKMYNFIKSSIISKTSNMPTREKLISEIQQNFKDKELLEKSDFRKFFLKHSYFSQYFTI